MYLVLVQILQTVEKITYDSRNLSLFLSLSMPVIYGRPG